MSYTVTPLRPYDFDGERRQRETDKQRNALFAAQMRGMQQREEFGRNALAQEMAAQQNEQARAGAQAFMQARVGRLQRAYDLVAQQPPETQAQILPQMVEMAKAKGDLPADFQAQDFNSLSLALSQMGVKPTAPKAPEYRTVGDSLVELGAQGPREVYRAPQKPTSTGTARPPSGYQFVTTPDGAQQLAPIPGGPADPNKPRPANPAVERARREALVRMPQVDAAVRRAERLVNASANLGNFLADGGPVDGLLLARTPAGQELEQAGASFMPVLTALTRVPGIGAQSDLEQRLAMLQLPTADMYPDVRARAAQELQLFMRDLRDAYRNIAAGNGIELPAEAAAAGPTAEAPAVVDFGSLR